MIGNRGTLGRAFYGVLVVTMRGVAAHAAPPVCAPHTQPHKPTHVRPSADYHVCASARQSAAIKAQARIALYAHEASYALGENPQIYFCVVNAGPKPLLIEHGGDYRSSRPIRFQIAVRDRRGVRALDPDPDPVSLGGLVGCEKLAPDASWCETLPLAEWALVDTPGTYTIAVTHDLGWDGGAPSATSAVTFVAPGPAQAEHVLAGIAAQPADKADFSVLHAPVYLAPLARRARAGDVRAISGIAGILTTDATRALVALAGDRRAPIAAAAADALALRLPDPEAAGAFGSRSSMNEDYEREQRRYLAPTWVPALADAVRAAAPALLASDDPIAIGDGAFLLESVGTAADASLVVRTFDRTLGLVTSQSFCGDCEFRDALLRAADMLIARGGAVAASPSTPGELAFWLVALAHRSPAPADWATVLAPALASPIPYLRLVAFACAPSASLPAPIVSLVRAGLRDRDPRIVAAAAKLATRAHLTALAPDVAAALRGMTESVGAVRAAARSLGAGEAVALDAAARLSDETRYDPAFHDLRDLLGLLERAHLREGATPSSAERDRVAACWNRFIAAHRAAITAGRAIPLTDPTVSPSLLPSGWTLERADGTEWP